jgi:hypothetical protein
MLVPLPIVLLHRAISVVAAAVLELKPPWLERKLIAAVEIAEVRAAPSPPLSSPLKQS